MKDKIVEVFNKLIGSLDTHAGGFSGRKMTALFIMIFVGKTHLEWLEYAHKNDNFTLLIEVLVVDFAMVGICLGLVTVEQIIKFKNKDEKPNQTAGTAAAN